MLNLTNAELAVAIVDPVADRRLLGHRYCWGGYVWQVVDPKVGPLLTGPEWPVATPDPFNGQGLPESFRHRAVNGAPFLWKGDIGLAPGAGRLGRDATGATIVTAPCEWAIESHVDRLVFHTRQSVGDWSYELVRKIELQGRQVLSVTQYTNRGSVPLVHEWFVHPFFALNADGRATVNLPEGTTLAENPGYALEERTLTFKRPFAGKDDGHFDHLVLPPEATFAVEVSHPRLKGLRFTTSFLPIRTAIWANGNTLSIEPFLALNLAPGETKQWSLTYEFGEPV